MTRFGEFSQSPYHNKHEGVKKLVAWWLEIYPRFDEKNCSRERLMAVAGADAPTLAVWMTYSLRLLEAFLAQEQAPLAPTALLAQYRRRRLAGFFEKKLATARTDLDEQVFRDSAYHLSAFQLASEAERFLSQQNRTGPESDIPGKQAALDHYYFSEKLRDACELEVRRKILKTEGEIPHLDWVLTEIREREAVYSSIPAIWVYFQVYRLLRAETQAFDDVQATLTAYESAFQEEELQLLYNYLQNFCIEQINRGNGEYLARAFDIYRRQLDRGLLLVQGELPEWHYKNMVAIGLRLREHSWVEGFIHQYKQYLPREVAENAFAFNLASLYYATGRLNQVQDLLTRVEYTDFRYSLGARALLLRTYYDLEEYEALRALSESLNQYLKRNKRMADERVLAFQRLLRLTRRALHLKMQEGFMPAGKWRGFVAALQKEVEGPQTIINREWLLEKIRAMAGG